MPKVLSIVHGLILALGVAVAIAAEERQGPFIIHDIAIDPANPALIYAVTGNYGLLKSADGGATWSLSNRGLRSFTQTGFLIHPANARVLYVGAWGGGVSRSLDQGGNWSEMNDGLGNTTIEAMAASPANPGRLYVATTAGVFMSLKDGFDWTPYNNGLPVQRIKVFQCLLVVPSAEVGLLLGTNEGLFKRVRGDLAWETVGGLPEGRPITALAYHTADRTIYAATLSGGLLRSRDGGKSWRAIGGPPKNVWVDDILPDPANPNVVYVATRSSGVMKTEDGGESWSEMNRGLPTRDVRSLAIDPKDSDVIYAGTAREGILRTFNGGLEWFRLTGWPLLSLGEIAGFLPENPSTIETPAGLAVPSEFAKCNLCHGWTDPILNQKKTYWRVATNRRNWSPVVYRMSRRAGLTPEETSRVSEFLTRYTGREP